MLAPAEDEYWTQEIEAPGQVGARMKMNRLALDHLGFIFDSHKGFVGVSLHSIERGGERENCHSMKYKMTRDQQASEYLALVEWVEITTYVGLTHWLPSLPVRSLA